MNAALALVVVVLAVVVVAVRRRVRARWDGMDLSAWHPAHRDPAGDVWAVTPPYGYGLWTLFAPGSITPGLAPYHRVTPAGVHTVDGFGGDSDRLRLVDAEVWMRPWIERVAGGRVVEMAEGWSEPYGPAGTTQEYVIYARVVTS
ncbi:hypothetical protein [Candidatus Frankia alpina]|uniref:Uncharacterized protein n=1 Tax=Candidatus Frankia alpina TaxID=2699483 RepID=A0A4S5EHN4_9ACTN|nr:hypothetical protein [Candidatus Frankia alpina]THJ71581.1 hypothetical protein E7Y31_15265 [Candidatus Frankia alpina]